jgi:hypothetical protein
LARRAQHALVRRTELRVSAASECHVVVITSAHALLGVQAAGHSVAVLRPVQATILLLVLLLLGVIPRRRHLLRLLL